MTTTLARLNVLIGADTQGFEGSVKRVQGALGGLQSQMTKTRSLTGLLAGSAGFGFAAQQAFELGSAVEETASKFATVFGDASSEVQGFIDTFGTMAGLSNEQAQGVLATTGSIVQGMGFAQDASARFSTEVVKLAGDLSSFNNIPIEQTSLAIQAALTGEREQLKRLGIVLREADVQQRALAISGGNAEMAALDQTRATATLQLVTERAGVAVGDLARTQDSAANQARALSAELQNIRETMAVALLPVMSVVLQNFGAFVKGIQIMGAEAAVFGSEIQLLVARLKFWDKEGIQSARQSLEFMRQAAEEVKLEIVGFRTQVDTSAVSAMNAATAYTTAATAAREVGTSVQVANVPFREMSVQLPTVTAGVYGLSTAQYALATATNTAADAQNRLNDSMNKAQGFLGALGSLGGAFGFAIPGLGQAGGLLSAFRGFQGLFADGGHISAGGWGIVGERGPEIVEGPANVTPMGEVGGTTVVQFPAPRSNFERMAQDYLAEGLRQLDHSGFRVRTTG